MSKNIQQVFATNPITSNISTDLMYFGRAPYGLTNDAAMTYANFAAQFGAPYTPSALNASNDTNVTITLSGSPLTALLNSATITMGWAGQLSGSRGGTGVNNGSNTITVGGNFQMSGAFTFNGTLTGNTAVTFPISGTLATTAQIPTGTPLTSVNDTNVTVTLGGSPTTALVNPASITVGWTGSLSTVRGGLGTSTVPTNGQLPIANAGSYLPSTLVAGTGIAIANVPGSGTVTITNTAGSGITPSPLTANNDTNITLTLGGTPATALLQPTSITVGWVGLLSGSRGGTGVNNGSSTITVGGNFQMSGAFTFNGALVGNTAVTFPTSGTLATTAQIPTGAPLTANNDTNITLTLGGSPATALINAASLTAGWVGTLSTARGGLGSGATPSNGQIPIGNGANYTAANITAGTGISVANGAGTITISATGATTNWVNQNTNSVTMAPNTGYTINNNLTLVTLTLPLTAVQGDFIEINGFSLGSWTLVQNDPGHAILYGNLFTTTGVTGSLTPTSARDCIRLRAATSKVWVVVFSTGSFNLV